MRVYGNIVNRIMEHTTGAPEIGLGCTICSWSDRHAATVVEIVSSKEIVVQEDKAIRTDDHGMSESQSYRYEANDKGCKTTFTKRKNGTWKQKGQYQSGPGLRLGSRDHYYDFSF